MHTHRSVAFVAALALLVLLAGAPLALPASRWGTAEAAQFSTVGVRSGPFLPVVLRSYPGYLDTFDNADSGWTKQSTAEGEWAYRDGEYELRVKRPNWWIGSAAPISVRTSYTIETTARRHNEANSEYGLVFDLIDWSRFYFFKVYPTTQAYALVRYEGGSLEPYVHLLPIGPDGTRGWLYSEHIVADGPNTLAVARAGNEIRLYINGELVHTLTDTAYASGGAARYVGVFAGQYAGSDARVRFAEFRATGEWAALAGTAALTSEGPGAAGAGPLEGEAPAP